MKLNIVNSFLLAILTLSFAACGTLFESQEGRDFIKGRVESLSFALVQELPDEAPTIQALAGVVRGVADGEDLSIGKLTAAIEALDIEELDSPYAPLLIKEITEWYSFYQSLNSDEPDDVQENLYRSALAAIAGGLEDGIEEWRDYFEEINQ